MLTAVSIEIHTPLGAPYGWRCLFSLFPFLVQNLYSSVLFTILALLCFTDPQRRLVAKIN
jgi:hypothetical protein